DIVIAGGLAGDGANFSHTWVLHENKIKSNTIIAVGLYGKSLNITNASRAGWDKFGPERVITKSSGNILFEIDNRPALDLYKEYLGEKSKELPASGLFFPLQIRSSKVDENRLIRTILAINEEQKSITFAGDVPEGHIAQLMKANFERVIEAANEAGEVIKKSNIENSQATSSKLTLAISCVGRRLVLGERAEEELEALMTTLPEKSLLTGFYSYGEIGATLTGGASDLHNQSMTVISLIENLNQTAKGSA
ncbi:MAG: FIST C-terminal domain-containing protein, partial [Bdellovibrionota bacterium]